VRSTHKNNYLSPSHTRWYVLGQGGDFPAHSWQPPALPLIATDFATQLFETEWQLSAQARTTETKSADRSTLPYPAPDSLGQAARSAKPFTPVQFRAWPPAKSITWPESSAQITSVFRQ
jgi:hypothetical protein